jgi:hypothetical protein
MRELKLQITGVEPAARGLTPLFHFKLHIEASPATDRIQAVLLNAQVQLECPQRSYTSAEKEKLVELFGTPDQWGKTLRNRLWTHANTTVGAFNGSTEALLPVPCTYDLNVAAAKYFHALEDGEVGVLFLFSGSIFYATPEGRLQVEPISWNTECEYRLPLRRWRDLMEQHFPNSAWLALPRELFERLYAFRRQHALTSWEETMERLLKQAAGAETSNSKPQTPSAEEVPT